VKKNMKKTIAIIMVGMFVIVGCGSAVMGDDDDPIGTNRPPKAPVFVEEKSDWTKESYNYVFYAEDPDGDQVYYDIAWEKISDTEIVSSPDDPVVPWLGPFESGEQLEKTHNFDKCGEYELTIRAKDSHDSIGPSTTITITYKKSISQLPLLFKIMEKYPEILKIISKIF
jgi:phage terminase large subunit-like protein